MSKLIFKRIDFCLQIILFLIVLSSTSKFNQVFFVSFFLIAFWQILSAIINFSWLKIHSKDRKSWQIISAFLVFFLLVILPIFSFFGLFFNFILYSLVLTLPLGTTLAIWYLIITWTELQELEKSEVGKLK